MLTHLSNALQPAGLVLVGAGLVSLVFSGPLAKLDSLVNLNAARVDHDYSRKWVEISGAVWGAVGIALLFVDYIAK